MCKSEISVQNPRFLFRGYFMETPCYLALNKKYELIEKICTEKNIEYESAVEQIGRNINKSIGFTEEQKHAIIDLFHRNYGIIMEKINENACDTIFYKESAPGEDDTKVFQFTWLGLFSCIPEHANINYVMHYFGETYEGSDVDKLIEATLRNNYTDYYASILL